jgi:hypothetical protein
MNTRAAVVLELALRQGCDATSLAAMLHRSDNQLVGAVMLLLAEMLLGFGMTKDQVLDFGDRVFIELTRLRSEPVTVH